MKVEFKRPRTRIWHLGKTKKAEAHKQGRMPAGPAESNACSVKLLSEHISSNCINRALTRNKNKNRGKTSKRGTERHR